MNYSLAESALPMSNGFLCHLSNKLTFLPFTLSDWFYRFLISIGYLVGVLRHTLFTLEEILFILSFLTSLLTVHNFSHVDLVCCWNVFITDYLCARFSVYLLGLETDISLRHRCFESQNQLCNMNRKPII